MFNIINFNISKRIANIVFLFAIALHIILIATFTIAPLSCFFGGNYLCHKFANELLFFFGFSPEIPNLGVSFVEKKHDTFIFIFGSILTLTTSLLASFFTIIIAFIIFQTVNKRQTEITRLSVLRQYEEDILRILESKSGLHADRPFKIFKWGHQEDYANQHYFNYRWALNEEPWINPEERLEETCHISRKHNLKNFLYNAHMEINGKNFVQIKANGDRVSSHVIHEILAWFRAINRARQIGVVDDDDLELLWRPILAHSFVYRYAFLKFYLKDDIQVFEKILVDVIKILKKRQPETWMRYKHYIKEDFQRFLQNNRINF